MIVKPVMNSSVEEMVLDALSQFQCKDKWKLWGMDKLREQGGCILLEGPPGTGKTSIARWMAWKIKHGFKKLSVADIGGGNPGATEKGVVKFFEDCKLRDNATIFIDECDHLLMSRDKVSGDGLTWMVGTTETIMMQINSYAGLVLMATNHSQSLDPALEDRFMSIIHVGRPEYEQRVLIWKQKWPAKFPLQPTEKDIAMLAKYDLSGRQIEMVFVNAASNAIRRKIKPGIKLFQFFCEREKGKHLTEGGKE